MSFLREMFAYIRQRRKFWLLPVMIVTLLLAGLVFVAQTTAIAPFLYALF